MKRFYILLSICIICLISLGLLTAFKQTNYLAIDILFTIGLVVAYKADKTYKKLKQNI